MAELGDACFDPQWNLLLPAPKPTRYHNRFSEYLEQRPGHSIGWSVDYALVLLERGRRVDITRAQAILQRVIALQEAVRPEDKRYGLWHYYAEQSVSAWPDPDFNTAEFTSLSLLMIWHLKRHFLDETTCKSMREAIRRAASCIRRRNIQMGYTNIAILGTFVVLTAGELFADEDLMAYAVDRMQRLHAEIFSTNTDSVAEFSSATYTPVSLAGLMAIDNFVKHESSRKLALETQHHFWWHIAKHFHAPTRELAGPHSRAYTIRLQDAPHRLGAMLTRATNGRLDYDFTKGEHDKECGAFHACFLKPNLPAGVEAVLCDETRCDTVTEIAEWRNRQFPVQTTTHLTPSYCVGSVNVQEGWEQRQNLIAYWRTSGGQVGYLRHRYLHDEHPCCSGYFAAAQEEGTVLVASFLGRYADLHFTDPVSEISAEYLGTEVEINNENELFEAWSERTGLIPGQTLRWRPNEHLWIKLPQVWIALRLIHHAGEPFAVAEGAVHFTGSTLAIRLPHYRGPRRTLKWTDFHGSHTSYALWMTEPRADWEHWQQTVCQQPTPWCAEDGKIRVTLNDLQLTVPFQLLPREEIVVLHGTRAGLKPTIPSQPL